MVCHSRHEAVVCSERTDEFAWLTVHNAALRRLSGVPGVIRVETKTAIATGAGPWGVVKRVCPATGASVWESFQAEQKLLTPLPDHHLPDPFDLVAQRRVGRDATVAFEGRTYSVPFRFVAGGGGARLLDDGAGGPRPAEIRAMAPELRPIDSYEGLARVAQ